jgi:RNA recognition motif-containing protein
VEASYNAGGYQSNPQQSSNAYYQPQQPGYGTSTPPVISNPYPAPPGAMPSTARGGFGRPGYDPEVEAQIAEWNSAYTPRDDANSKKPGQSGTPAAFSGRSGEASGTPDPDSGAGANGENKGKQKTVVRAAGGKQWEDSSLLEWDPLHPRLFVGNLAGEVTDDSLLKAFSKYTSVSKARVIRDKKTTKSKSYGFVSFSNTDDYFRAAKEMEGKYIGSHPVRIKRANTEINATAKKDHNHGKHGKNNNNKNKGNASNTVISGAPMLYSGVQKSGHKGKSGGPRILG